MSRTDKTKPLWVRYAEHRPLPSHDHRYGPCDLPPKPSREHSNTRCRWNPGLLWISATCCLDCGVKCCSKERQAMTRAEHRRRRYADRRTARRYRIGELVD